MYVVEKHVHLAFLCLHKRASHFHWNFHTVFAKNQSQTAAATPKVITIGASERGWASGQGDGFQLDVVYMVLTAFYTQTHTYPLFTSQKHPVEKQLSPRILKSVNFVNISHPEKYIMRLRVEKTGLF